MKGRNKNALTIRKGPVEQKHGKKAVKRSVKLFCEIIRTYKRTMNAYETLQIIASAFAYNRVMTNWQGIKYIPFGVDNPTFIVNEQKLLTYTPEL